MIMREKKNIVSLILLTVVIKIIVHFFVFPTEVIVTNTDKKIYVYKNRLELMRLKRGYDFIEKGNNLIVNGESVFYYPKEKEKVSLAKHIEETFTQKLWLFPWVIFLLLLLFWINYKSDKDKSNDTIKKHNFSSYLSKQNIIVILLLSLSISSNIYLFIKINKDNIHKTNQNYMNSTEEYMNQANEYMNQAREYMNNADQSAQDAEEFAE
jgi:hypothetical protein